MNPDKNNQVKQVQLPSGKVIEVVYLADQPQAAHSTQAQAPEVDVPRHLKPGAEPGEDLHVCVRCSGDLVYPVDWAESGPSHWEVSLRCPDCEWTDSGVFNQDVVERFDIELDRGAEVLLRDLQHLAHANMAEDIERFITALQADHIVPADF